jgi:hypothetical protein
MGLVNTALDIKDTMAVAGVAYQRIGDVFRCSGSIMVRHGPNKAKMCGRRTHLQLAVPWNTWQASYFGSTS